MRLRALLLACGFVALPGCGSLLESTLPAPQSYVLRLPARTPAASPANPGSLLVQRPEAGPGLSSEYIALLRSGQRFDFYAASRWAAPAPDLLESVIVDQLRGTGLFAAVFDDASPYAATYDLRCEMRRFEADYTSHGRGGSRNAPTVHVVLDCTLGRHRNRTLLSSFTAQGSAAASDDRLGDVIAAFEAATAAALGEMERHTAVALGAEQPTAAR
jgi:cholesterol transport system auxiliary component